MRFINIFFNVIAGKVGDWKNVFTVAQSELFAKWMKEHSEKDDEGFPLYL